MSLRTLFGLSVACLAAAQSTIDNGSAMRSQFQPADEATLLRLRDTADVGGMRQHAWNVLVQITQRTLSGEPVWQTWESYPQIFSPSKPQPEDVLKKGLALAKETELAEKSLPDTDKSEGLFLLSSTHFNPEASQHIRMNRLNHRDQLKDIIHRQTNAYEAPAIPAFPRGAVVVKAAWWLVGKSGRTAMPVWDPVEVGATPRPVSIRTSKWKRCVAIDPNQVTEGTLSEQMPCGGQKRPLPVVSLSQFYFISLTDQMRDHISTLGIIKNHVYPRDPAYAVLVGLHVTTKEIPNWVWATLWWHDQPHSGPYAADRPAALEPPWTNYLMDTTLSADTPRESDEQPKICFNPWLEGQLPLGITANCMACHRRAAFPIADDEVSRAAGSVNPRGNGSAPPYKDPVLLLDFLWSIQPKTP
jgi:hypothetical protein